MVSRRQRDDIEALMRHIKEAKNNGRSREEIKRRANALYHYLEEEGIIMPEDE